MTPWNIGRRSPPFTLGTPMEIGAFNRYQSWCMGHPARVSGPMVCAGEDAGQLAFPQGCLDSMAPEEAL